MNTIQWLEIIDLAEELKCSVKSVYNYREEGTFLPGIHFYTVGKGKQRGKHIYSLELCRKALIDRTKKNAKAVEVFSYIQVKDTVNKKNGKKSNNWGYKQ